MSLDILRLLNVRSFNDTPSIKAPNSSDLNARVSDIIAEG